MSPPAAHLSDDELMGRVVAQDARAFEVIYDRYSSRAFGMALRVTGRPTTAEEVTQDAFLSLWRGAHLYDPGRGSLGSWLLSLVHNRAIDALRRTSRHDRNDLVPEAALQHLEAPELTHDQAVMHEQTHQVREALTALPEDQRQTIALAYFAGLSQAEIAARSHVALGTVKGRTRLALRKLSRTLAATG
jgi:RNA polymerase sigma-70 factor (ECF subfamily)